MDLAAWLESELDELGTDVERVAATPGRPNLLATVEGAVDRTLCFNGHADTVPFDAHGWSYDPPDE